MMAQQPRSEQRNVGATALPVFDAKEELRLERESFTLDDAMAYLRDDTAAFSSAFVGVGVGIGAIETFKTRRFKPKWSAEVLPTQQEMWKYLTDVMCLGNFFELDPGLLPWFFLLAITLPCTDFSTAGKQLGDKGSTGWMFVAAVKQVLAMPKLPEMVEIETADGILATNGGRELREAKTLLAEHFVVKIRKINAFDYGSISHRKRVVIVCIRRGSAYENDFEMHACTNMGRQTYSLRQ